MRSRISARRLCAVAERLFAERGPQGVTMRELARELGVSAMTPYRYFKDKESILAAVRANAFDDFAAALEQAALHAGQRRRTRRRGRPRLSRFRVFASPPPTS